MNKDQKNMLNEEQNAAFDMFEACAEDLSRSIGIALVKGVEIIAIREELSEVLERHGLQCLVADEESLHDQIDRLAKFIMAEVPGEPSENQGAVDTAIRVIRKALGLRMPREAARP